MNVFTLLVFKGSDSVSEVRTIRAEDAAQARRTVELIMRTQPAAAGHQLWRNGVCISRTYPTAYPGRTPASSGARNGAHYESASEPVYTDAHDAMSSAGE